MEDPPETNIKQQRGMLVLLSRGGRKGGSCVVLEMALECGQKGVA